MYGQSHVTLNERHADHPAEVLRGLFKSGEDSAALFQPANQAFNTIAIAICLLVKLDKATIAILVTLGRDHRLDIQIQQVFIDPVGAIPLVARQRHRPGDRLAFFIDQLFIGADHERIEYGRFVRLTGGQMKVKRMTVPIAQNVDFTGQTAATAAERVVVGFV